MSGTDLNISNRTSLDRPVDFDALFRLYSQELNDFAYRRLRDREAAADIVQDGFERFLRWTRKSAGEHRVDSPRFFLWTIVGNLSLDLIRRNRTAVIEPLTPLSENIADPMPGPDRWVEARQQYGLVRKALNDMPERYRTALLLNRLHGLTHAQIGVHFGVSTSMATKYVIAALEICISRLRKQR